MWETFQQYNIMVDVENTTKNVWKIETIHMKQKKSRLPLSGVANVVCFRCVALGALHFFCDWVRERHRPTKLMYEIAFDRCYCFCSVSLFSVFVQATSAFNLNLYLNYAKATIVFTFEVKIFVVFCFFFISLALVFLSFFFSIVFENVNFDVWN